MAWNKPSTWFRSTPTHDQALATAEEEAYHRASLAHATTRGQGRALLESIGDAEALDVDANLPGLHNQALFRATGQGPTRGNDFGHMQMRAHRGVQRKLVHLNMLSSNLHQILVDFIFGEGMELKAIPPELEPVAVAAPAPPVPPVPPPPAAVGGGSPADPDEAAAGNGLPPPPPTPPEPVAVPKQDPEFIKFGELLDEFWNEPTNDLANEVEGMVGLLLNEGEHLLPVLGINPIDGHLRLGHIVNDRILDVMHGVSVKPMVAIVQHPDPQETRKLRYFLINSATPEDEFTFMDDGTVLVSRLRMAGGMPTIEQDVFDGLAHYWFVNKIRGANRGKGMQTPSMDQLDQHDEVLWNFAERVKLLSHFLYHVQFPNAQDKADIDKGLADIGMKVSPPAGTTIGTGKDTTITAISPKLESGPVTDIERTIRTNVAGQQGIPEGFTGPGGETNLATLKAQGSVPFRRFKRIQGRVVGFLRQLVDFQQVQWVKHGELSADYEGDYEVATSSLDDKDRTSATTALTQLVAAGVLMVDNDIYDVDTVRKVVTTNLREQGYDITERDAMGPDQAVVEQKKADDRAMQQERMEAMRQATGPGGAPQEE